LCVCTSYIVILLIDNMRKSTGITKVHRTLTMPISFWALVEQIRSKQGLDTPDEAINVSVMSLARKIGIEA